LLLVELLGLESLDLLKAIFFLPSFFSTDDKVSRFPKNSVVVLAFSWGVFSVSLEGL
jgi:hypothetical protein